MLPRSRIGKLVVRDRVLDDGELRAVWRACDDLAYPFGTAVKLLIISGARLREIGELRWSEVDLDAKLITVGAARMKGGTAHEIPICPMMAEILHGLPRFKGPYVFSGNGGRTPYAIGSTKAKHRLDQASGVTDWRMHDLRRVFRSGIAPFAASEDVKELCLSHVRPGIKGTYDRYQYRNEKREVYQLWETKLGTILNPRPKLRQRPLT